jgi:hypothetical protein
VVAISCSSSPWRPEPAALTGVGGGDGEMEPPAWFCFGVTVQPADQVVAFSGTFQGARSIFLVILIFPLCF